LIRKFYHINSAIRTISSYTNMNGNVMTKSTLDRHKNASTT